MSVSLSDILVVHVVFDFNYFFPRNMDGFASNVYIMLEQQSNGNTCQIN